MNIFVLDPEPELAARYHCDKHVTKMTVETGQMLSTCHRVLDGDEAPQELYRAAYVNHPCNVWLRKCAGNYFWTLHLFEALAREFRYRYGAEHKTYKKLKPFVYDLPQNIPYPNSLATSAFALAMSQFPQCIVPGNAIQSYRNFYQEKQKHFKMRWTKRECPIWFNVLPQQNQTKGQSWA